MRFTLILLVEKKLFQPSNLKRINRSPQRILPPTSYPIYIYIYIIYSSSVMVGIGWNMPRLGPEIRQKRIPTTCHLGWKSVARGWYGFFVLTNVTPLAPKMWPPAANSPKMWPPAANSKETCGSSLPPKLPCPLVPPFHCDKMSHLLSKLRKRSSPVPLSHRII